MKKYLLLTIIIFSVLASFSQDIVPYYLDVNTKEYKSKGFRRFQISTNSRAIYRDIPIIIEAHIYKKNTIGLMVGFMPPRNYKFLHLLNGVDEIKLDKMAMTYGVMYKNWVFAEAFEGGYFGLSYLYANLPDNPYQTINIEIGSVIDIKKRLFLNVAFGSGIRMYKNEFVIPSDDPFDPMISIHRELFFLLEIGFGVRI